jgi:antitoxin ParD1/3/4
MLMEQTTMNVSMPVVLKEYVEKQAEALGYASSSEYIRELVREDQKRRAEARLEALLLEGLNSGDPIEVTPQFWEEGRKRLEQLIAKRQRELAK